MVVLVAALLVTNGCSDDPAMTTIEFAGSECVAEIPSSVAPGDHTFVLTNTSDRPSLPVYAVQLSDGHSYEEFSSLQSAPGDYFVLPDWARFAVRGFEGSDGAVEDRRRFVFSLEPGEHAVYLWASRPAAIWLCGSLTVTPDPED